MNRCENCNAVLPGTREGVCAKCVREYFELPRPERTFGDLLAYLRTPLQREPLVDAATGAVVPWPDRKDPALYHARLCRRFPEWGRLVEDFKTLRGIKYFDKQALDDLIDFLREPLADEEIAASPVAAVAAVVRDELWRVDAAAAGRAEAAPLPGLSAAAES